ncbi:MAG: GntG family PLP-dependent aldolase [Sphaerochaetaceae bacterium]|jgi:threonine aldolase
MQIIDFRSDTITKPTEPMRQAMYEAEVGDDVYREDPSVNELEAMGAEISGKEKALFVTSGSMGNLISLYINCTRGCEVLASDMAHIIHHEIGAPAAIAGVLPRGLAAPNGILSRQILEGQEKPVVYDLQRTSMVEVENTIGGLPYPVENLKGIRAYASEHGMKVHMDGARVFNASVATGVSVKEYGSYADTLTFCLSKGLGAPVGSLLCSDADFIEKALKLRKMLGGGMRQSGILAAAGIYALRHNVDRLAEDHENAQALARTISQMEWATIDLSTVVTNILFFSIRGLTPDQGVRKLAQAGILANTDYGRIRLVTNLNVSRQMTREACERIKGLKI